MDPRSSDPVWLNEFSFLGSLILSYELDVKDGSEMRAVMMDTVKPHMLQDPAHRDIYSAIVSLYLDGQALDPVLVVSRLRDTKALGNAGGAEYIGRLVAETPNPLSGKEYANNVAAFWRRRTVAMALKAVLAEVEATKLNDPLDVMGVMDRAIRAIGEATDGATVAYLSDFLDDAMQMNFQSELPIVTRIAKIDGNINLFAPGELTILAARPSIGKSSLMRQICANAATAGEILVASLEVPPRTLSLQFACEMSGVAYYDYTKGKVSQDDVLRVMHVLEDPTYKRIAVMRRTSVSALDISIALADKKARGKEVACVVIDYLGLMRHEKAERHDIAIGNTTRALKQLAIQRNVPIILLAQLNREVEKRGGNSECDRPRLADLRDSGNIEQDADNVLFLWRKEREDQYKLVEPRTLTVAKHRNGLVFEVDLMFEKAKGRFYEAPDISAPPSESPADYYRS